jgi:hypothetical protein
MVLRYITVVLFQDMPYVDEESSPVGSPAAAANFRQRQRGHQTMTSGPAPRVGQQPPAVPPVARFLRNPAAVPSVTAQRDHDDDEVSGGVGTDDGEEAMLRAERLRREEESRRRRMRRRQQMLSANLT